MLILPGSTPRSSGSSSSFSRMVLVAFASTMQQGDDPLAVGGNHVVELPAAFLNRSMLKKRRNQESPAFSNQSSHFTTSTFTSLSSEYKQLLPIATGEAILAGEEAEAA